MEPENLAEMLENHELRRLGGVLLGLLGLLLSREPDRERRRVIGMAGEVAWPLEGALLAAPGLWGSPDVGLGDGAGVVLICWGRAGLATFAGGGDGGLRLILSAHLGQRWQNEEGGGAKRRGASVTLWRGLCHPTNVDAVDLLHAFGRNMQTKRTRKPG